MKKKLILVLILISFFGIINFTHASEPIIFCNDIFPSVDIESGTIDGTIIGATTPAAGTFTDITITGNTILDGAQSVKRTATGAADYNPSTLTTDYIIAVDNTVAARAVTISTEDENSGTVANPRIFVIKDESGGAAAHNITISLESGGNIDGAATLVLNQPYQSIQLYIDGTNAFTIGGN